MTDEHEQLRSYARTGAEADFAAVVQRFLPLVYSAALRRVYGDTHRAQDVTQLVFVALARHAATLSRHPDLAGWMFTTTRFLAAKALRSERRRSSREREAGMSTDSTTADPAPGESSDSVHAMLDDLVADLKPIDRQVILLRFHRGLRLSEIGTHINATENAVQKRLDRALEQLREKLARRGVTSTAAALTLALEQQAVAAIPAGLAATATQAALALGASQTGLFGGLGFMAISKLHLSLAAVVALGGGAGLLWQYQQNHQLRADLTRQTVAAETKLADLQRQFAAQTARASAAEADVATLLTAVKTNAASPSGASRVSSSAKSGNSLDLYNATSARAAQLIRAGKQQEALDEYLRAYQEQRAERPGSPACSMLLSSINRLGRSFPPAITTLRDLRASALQQFEAKPGDATSAREIAECNNLLGESHQTVALYDRVSADSPLRQSFALFAHDALVEARRYTDAMVGKSYGSMLNDFDRGLRVNALPGFQGASAPAARADLVRKTAFNIETLTGAGLLAEARSLTEKLLANDSSDATRATIQQHIDRARPQGGLPPAR